MAKFSVLTSKVVPLFVDNVDTDQIIPARFLKTISKDGLGDQLFYDWRYDKFNEVRFASGLEWSIAHFVALEFYYTRQHTTTSSPQFVNALGGKLKFYFRNKRD